MPDSDPCPDAAGFQAMLLGLLEGPRADALESHLERCPACQRLLDALVASDPFTAVLRVRPTEAVSDAPAVRDLVARIEDMGPQFTALFDASHSASAATGPDEPAFDPESGEAFGPRGAYRIERLLGAGGMGMVYLAEDRLLLRRVAVKVLRPRWARKSLGRESFLREARAMAALKHDNIVTVFQVGEAEQPSAAPIPFLVMELLSGESLADWVRRAGRMPPAWVARLGRQVAQGLAAAHAQGVVHRDIKPGNLWLEAPAGWTDLDAAARPPLASVARLKVLDFGLAQPTGEDSAEAGRVRLGTPAYMAPEQAAGREVDHRADLFSLGVVLYELTTGRQPFPRESRHAAMTYPVPPAVADLMPGTPPALAGLIRRLLSTDPASRPSSAREVEAELASFDAPPIRSRWPVLSILAAAVVLLALGGWHAANWLRPALPDDVLSRPGPPDEEWRAAVAALPGSDQPSAVVAKLRQLNPDYDGRVTHFIVEDGRVSDFAIQTDGVSDISPVATLRGLKRLTVAGSKPGKGKLVDLSPIRGLALNTLNVWQNPKLSDLSPARGMKLVLFQAGDTAVEDLKPLEGMPIVTLAVNGCLVRDLSPVTTMRSLNYLRCDGCPVSSLAPLSETSIRTLVFTLDRARGDLDVIGPMEQLERINGVAAAQFRRKHGIED